MSSCTEVCKSQHHCHHNHHQNQHDSHNHDHDADDQPDQGCHRVCEHVTVDQAEFLALPRKSSTSPGDDVGVGVGVGVGAGVGVGVGDHIDGVL